MFRLWLPMAERRLEAPNSGSRFRAPCTVPCWYSQTACQMLSLCPVASVIFHRFSGSEIFLSTRIPKISSQVLSWLPNLMCNPELLNHCYAKPILTVSILAFPSLEAFLLIRNSKERKMDFVFQDCAFWFHFKHYSALPFLTSATPE